jgi:hypothetical protein
MPDINREVLDALKKRSQYPICREYFGLKEVYSRRVNADDVSAEAVRSVRDELRAKGHELQELTGKQCYIEIEREGEEVYVVRLSLGVPQKEREARGIDTVGWNLTYSQIVGEICSEGEVESVDDVVKAEVDLEKAVRARVYDKSIPYDNQFDRNDVRDYALADGMDPNKVERIFDFLAERNRHVQDLSKPLKPLETKPKKKENGFSGGWQVRK